MERRHLLSLSLGAAFAVILDRRPLAAAPPDVAKVTIVEYSDAGVRGAVVEVTKVVRTEPEWRRQLSALSFDVTRQDATEQPFSGATWNTHDAGLYRCICCGTALFASSTKFDSRTGWPSFWKPLDARNIREHVDMSQNMIRMAVSCRRCDAHLGHVFDDGPKPTGLRYCMNSAAMRFVKA